LLKDTLMPVRDTRAALIAAAIDTLRESGFAAASARRIAQRAGCNQALIFYHFGSVPDLLVAALEDISARRMAAYRELLAHTATLAELAVSARAVFEQDLDAGHVTVLVEMISAAQSVPGLGDRIAACLAPWREFAETAVRDILAGSPLGSMLPAGEAGHAVVAGILGLEMLATLDGDRGPALALFDRARTLGELLDRLRPLAVLLDLARLRKGEQLCRPTSSRVRSATQARPSPASCSRPDTRSAR
jgi:AcrR family transcriptional regulator